MSRNSKIWNTKENAKFYDDYALHFPMYKDTSKDLVEIADIKPGMTVVDLATGTGITTQAIIEKTNGDIRVIAVDQAEEMLNKAKEKFIEKNIKFIVSEAENIDKVIAEPIDIVVCNSAFWQMRTKEVLNSVSSILKQNGIFAFNLPDTFLSHKGFKRQPTKISSYNIDDLKLWGKEVGLILINESIKTYNKSLEEMLAFNEIPVMKKNFNTEDERNDFINSLKSEFVGNIPAQRQWVYLEFKKLNS